MVACRLSKESRELSGQFFKGGVPMTDSERIRLVFDREQIRETIYRYPVSIDTRDWKLFRSIFTDEIEIFLGVAVRAKRPLQRVKADDFTQSVTAVITSFSVTQHMLSDYHIEVKGDEASCLFYMYARPFPPADRP